LLVSCFKNIKQIGFIKETGNKCINSSKTWNSSFYSIIFVKNCGSSETENQIYSYYKNNINGLFSSKSLGQRHVKAQS
jgi:hypothetical protein